MPPTQLPIPGDSGIPGDAGAPEAFNPFAAPGDVSGPLSRERALVTPSIQELMEFIRPYAATLLAAGGQTSRVDRTTARIARAYGYRVELIIFTRRFTLSIVRNSGAAVERRTAVCSCLPDSPNFQRVVALNALSWSIANEHLPFYKARQEFAAICALPGIAPQLLPPAVAVANAAFCGLFQGDLAAMGIVGGATLVTFSLRQKLLGIGLDLKLVTFACALLSSLIASLGVLLHWGDTPQIALASSVLFLIPGMALINSTLDVLDGHILMGFARLVHASILIVCIALGLSTTMLLLGVDAL